MTERVFVSYSHHDASLVTPVVRLLRSTNDFVFLDSDSIKPGQRWRQALSEAMEQANLVVVFWCTHSNQSAEVESEYRSAIEARKDVLPVLLDSTPVPPGLDQYQWIDFRELGRGRHSTENRPDTGPSAPKLQSARLRWLIPVAASAAVLVMLIGGSFWMLRSSGPQDAGVGPPPVSSPSEAAPSLASFWVIALLVVLASVAFFAIRRRRQQPAGRDMRAADPRDTVMANALEEELRRRLRPDGA